jgi:hypothetical protein
MKLHLIGCHRFAVMRPVRERSLASILRSELLTTLINNDVSGKVNANGWARALDKFDVMQMWSSRVRIGGEQAPVSGTLLT